MTWRDVSRDEAEAALFFHNKVDELADWTHEQVQALVAQWGPRRKAQLERFQPGTLQAMKMEAFYKALDRTMAKWTRPSTDLDDALDYMYSQKEGG